MMQAAFKALQAITYCALFVAAVMAVLYLPRLGLPVAPDAGQAFTRAEFITIILSAVTAILSALMIMLAILAFWGYSSLRQEARKAAENIARDVAKQVAETVAAREANALMTRASGERSDDNIAEAFSHDDAR